MRAIIITSVILLAFFPVFAEAIKAIETPGAGDFGLPAPPKNAQTVPGLLSVVAGIVRVVYIVFFSFAVMMFLFAAFIYVTASDDAAAVQKAHWWLIYGSIGVIVALLAVGVSAIISQFLENPSAGLGGVGGEGGAGSPPPADTAPPAPTITFPAERGAAGGTVFGGGQVTQPQAPVNPRANQPSVPRSSEQRRD